MVIQRKRVDAEIEQRRHDGGIHVDDQRETN